MVYSRFFINDHRHISVSQLKIHSTVDKCSISFCCYSTWSSVNAAVMTVLEEARTLEAIWLVETQHKAGNGKRQ